MATIRPGEMSRFAGGAGCSVGSGHAARVPGGGVRVNDRFRSIGA